MNGKYVHLDSNKSFELEETDAHIDRLEEVAALYERKQEKEPFSLSNFLIRDSYILLIAALILGTFCIYDKFEEYGKFQEPRFAKVLSVNKDCAKKSCFYYSMVLFEGTTQLVNIGAYGYNTYKEGKTYDFRPNYGWILGASGTAYAVERETDPNVFKSLFVIMSLFLITPALIVWFIYEKIK